MAGKKVFTTSTLKKSSDAPQTSSKEVLATFSLFAPNAKKVSAAGSFNNWNTNALKLKKDSQGNWTGSASLKTGRYEYLFFVDGEWVNDPKARETVTNAFGTINSVRDVR